MCLALQQFLARWSSMHQLSTAAGERVLPGRFRVRCSNSTLADWPMAISTPPQPSAGVDPKSRRKRGANGTAGARMVRAVSVALAITENNCIYEVPAQGQAESWMPIYIVAYDIGKTTDREKLEAEIRNNFNDSSQINKSVWLLETVIDLPGIKARLLQFMANGNCLIISRLAAQVAVQALADDGSTWLDSKGIRVL
jgi:hypothetical protein